MRKIFKFLIAQVGLKPGKKISVPMLLQVEEIPWPGWRLSKDLTLRAAVVGMVDKADLRARGYGSVWAIRSFVNVGKSQWLLLRVIPMASTSDARSWISSFETRVATNEDATSIKRVNQELNNPDRSNLGPCFCLEYVLADSRSGKSNDAKAVAGSVGNVMFLIRCIGPGDGWSWQDVTAIASRQGAKIRKLSANATK
jgi:hypothetical protein